MTEINVDGVIYRVGEAEPDPSEMKVYREGTAVGHIGRFGEHYRFYEVDGGATTIVRPRSDEGIRQMISELHARLKQA